MADTNLDSGILGSLSSCSSSPFSSPLPSFFPALSSPFFPSFLSSFFSALPASSAGSSGCISASVRIILLPPSSSSGRLLYSPFSGFLVSTNHWLILSWISSFMSGPSVSKILSLRAMRAFSYSTRFSCWMFLLRSRFLTWLVTGFSFSSLGFGFIPMKMSSSSSISFTFFRVMWALTTDWILMAASFGAMILPLTCISVSKACCLLSFSTSLVFCLPCLPRSLAWMILMASSSGKGMSFSAAASAEDSTLYLSSSAFINFLRSPSSFSLSDTKYLGIGISTLFGVSFRSTRMLSKLTRSTLSFRVVSQSRISSIRPRHASKAFFMSSLF